MKKLGGIGPSDVNKFMKGVRQYYESAAKYKFPFDDEVLKHSKFVDFEDRENAEYTDVEYFLDRYSALLDFSPEQLNELH